MYQLGEIGMFQLENLIRNKVPFKLFLIGAAKPENLDQSSPLLQDFWERTFEINKQEAMGQIVALSVGQEAPIIFAAPDPGVSQSLAQEMASSGYLNCFFVGIAWDEVLVGLEDISF